MKSMLIRLKPMWVVWAENSSSASTATSDLKSIRIKTKSVFRRGCYRQGKGWCMHECKLQLHTKDPFPTSGSGVGGCESYQCVTKGNVLHPKIGKIRLYEGVARWNADFRFGAKTVHRVGGLGPAAPTQPCVGPQPSTFYWFVCVMGNFPSQLQRNSWPCTL